MRNRFRFILCLLLMFSAGRFLYAAGSPAANTSANPDPSSPAASSPEPSPAGAISDPLLQLLVTKGVLTATEAGTLHGTSGANQRQLIELLKAKGVLSDSDLATLQARSSSSDSSSATTLMASAPQASSATASAPAPPPPPKFIAAVAPVRVMPIDPPKREGLIPALKIGPVRTTPYGFLKADVIHDTSSPRGDDFPLPQFIFGDTGPNPSPEFRVKARSTRFGSNFEWLDASPKLAITGKVEMDFEGNFTAVDNRNVSSIRSNQVSLRLAYGRLDYAATDKTNIYGVFGQDWTPFGSSTLPNSLETSGVGISFGSLYERDPQVRGGFVHNFGGGRTTKLLMEAAVVLPAFGNVPSTSNLQIPGTIPGNNVVDVIGPTGAVIGTVAIPQTANTGAGLANQLAFGERQGVDSGRPEVQGRIALQFQLDKAPGVVPAQIIVSGVQAERDAIVIGSSVPKAFKAAFPRGVVTDSQKWGISTQVQLPTRWVTVLASWYRGGDLRWFFAGELFSFYNNTVGLTNTATAPSIDGSAAVVFGLRNGVPTVAPQEPVRTTGGFIELGLPLSRWFNANPAGRNAGWTMNLHYGLDDAFARDVRRFNPGGARDKSDWIMGNIQYKLNTWVTFGLEEAQYRTRAVPGTTGALPLWQGFQSREAKDIRSQFSTIFTFEEERVVYFVR